MPHNICALFIGFFLINNPDIDLLNKYSRLSQVWEDDLKYKTYNNLDGELAWNVSYGISSYLELYEITDDINYLEKSIAHIEKLLLERDDIFGRIDYKNESNATWVCEKYTNGHPYAFVVHSGMICYPLIRMAYTIKNAEQLHLQKPSSFTNYFFNKTYLEIAQILIGEVEKTVLTHLDQWDEEKGVFRFRNDTYANKYFGQSNEILPLNQQSAMGRTLLYLSKALDDDKYLDYVTQIARYIKSNLKKGENYSYYWNYSEANPIVEDISHAALNVSFIYECYINDIVFIENDLIKLSNTLRYSVFEFSTTTRKNVNGGGEKNKYQLQLGRWLNLAEFDPNLSHMVYRLYSKLDFGKESGSSAGSVLHGLSLLIKYYDANYTFENYFRIYPIPANDNINIEFRKKFISPVELNIIDNNGVTVVQRNYATIEKNAVLNLPTINLTQGINHLLILNNGNIVRKKIIINSSSSTLY